MGNDLHPNQFGMDKICNELISCMLGVGTNTYNISWNLSKVQSTLNTNVVLEGASFQTYLISADSSENLSVSVTMGGKDITEKCYKNGQINIPCVSGDVIISAETIRSQQSFYWKIVNGQWVSISGEGLAQNNPTLKKGSITSEGQFSSAYYELAYGHIP